MYYTVVNITGGNLPPGKAYDEFKNLPLPKTANGRKIWLQRFSNEFVKFLRPFILKGGFEFAPDLFRNFKLLYYPKSDTYSPSLDIYFEDTYNEGEKMMIKYIKKTGLFDYAYAKILNKYIQL